MVNRGQHHRKPQAHLRGPLTDGRQHDLWGAGSGPGWDEVVFRKPQTVKAHFFRVGNLRLRVLTRSVEAGRYY